MFHDFAFVPLYEGARSIPEPIFFRSRARGVSPWGCLTWGLGGPSVSYQKPRWLGGERARSRTLRELDAGRLRRPEAGSVLPYASDD
eukprot:5394491-Prymnesium_polylepis.1